MSKETANAAKTFTEEIPAEDLVALGKHIQEQTYKKGLIHGALAVLIVAPIAMWIGWNVAAWVTSY